MPKSSALTILLQNSYMWKPLTRDRSSASDFQILPNHTKLKLFNKKCAVGIWNVFVKFFSITKLELSIHYLWIRMDEHLCILESLQRDRFQERKVLYWSPWIAVLTKEIRMCPTNLCLLWLACGFIAVFIDNFTHATV